MGSLSLSGKISIVTGATRGIGKAIAIQLGQQGSKVYITGRTLSPQDGVCLPGSLEETARDIHARGGVCVPIQCDHSKDIDIQRLFERITAENDGRLDIFVNNAFSGNDTLLKERGKPFWEQSLNMWDDINEVGLRNNYLCAIYASKLMVPRKNGIIINVSSAGASMYMLNPAYGIGKAGVDRMTADCALELRKHNIAFVSLSPGPVSSDTLMALSKGAENRGENIEEYRKIAKIAESPCCAGECVIALANDPNIMEKTGKVFSTVQLAEEYGIVNKKGNEPEANALETFLNFVQGHIN
ncbi:dehydrogenase/reductase SDR family member 1-like [Ruditapes philippinarum]|uniref:dehydrogenase/reductase SDR family member 1-like n=1 Tax=Ruditapes philippinarum TaxID=129788 RepID=UPI00295C1368|nr:dehydrogenase/reductase SDR family member 1-like [Ruditapes philippinarum]